MRDVLVRCGGFAAKRPPGAEVLELDVDAPRTSAARVTLRLDHITERMVEGVPDVLADLVEVACYVYCADQFTRRDTPKMTRLGENWRRRFQFVIPVRHPEIWSRPELLNALTNTLAFLSEDAYEFRFAERGIATGLQPYLDFAEDGPPTGFAPDEVVLFSGGLDSLAGAAQLLRDGQRVALVSHQSSPMVRSKQLDLVAALRERTPGPRLFHVGVTVTKGKQEATDFTQRSRSFLFAALGFVIARLFDRREVTFFENGVLSMNLPIARHVIGARATRTTHPRVLAGFSELFTLLAGDRTEVINPFFWLTKTEVVSRLADLGCADLVARSFSCTRVRYATQAGRHCGICSQCVDRRFAILAAGSSDHEPADTYALDLLRGELPPGRDVTLAESYVLTASRFSGISPIAFAARYGEVFRSLPYLEGTPEQNLAAIHRLHARHGAAIDRVVRQERARESISEMLALPGTSLLALVQSNVAEPSMQLDPVETEPSASEQASKMTVRPVPRPIRFAVNEAAKCIVFAPGVLLTRAGYRLFTALLPEHHAGRAEGLPPKKFPYVGTEDLADRLGVEQHAVRQNVHRTRERLAVRFLEQCGAALEDGDIIESPGWKGYRLNPFMEERALSFILGSNEAGQTMSRNRSRGVTTRHQER